MSSKIFIPVSDSSENLLQQKANKIFEFIRSPYCYKAKEFIRMILIADNNEFYRKFFVIQDEYSLKDNSLIKPKFSGVANNVLDPIVFMFPGQGLEYYGVGKILYAKYTVFRDAMDECFKAIKATSNYDLKHILYKSESQFPQEQENIQVTSLITFSFEYALARLLLSFDIIPTALIGYSIGEYVVATLAEVFSLQDAIALVNIRGTILKDMKPGRMLSVPEKAETVFSLLSSLEISLAADHGESCVISGEAGVISQAETILKAKRILTQYLNINRAGHSSIMDGRLDQFIKQLQGIKYSTSKLPVISTVTGKWQTEEMSHPDYWVKQLTQTVEFNKSINTLLDAKFKVFLEIGIGSSLTTLVAQKKIQVADDFWVMNLAKDQYQSEIDEDEFLVLQLSRIWVKGLGMSWHKAISLNDLKNDQIQGRNDEIVR